MKATAEVSFTFNVGRDKSTINSVPAKFEFLRQNGMGAPKPAVVTGVTQTAPEFVSENDNAPGFGVRENKFRWK